MDFVSEDANETGQGGRLGILGDMGFSSMMPIQYL
jgi:hypothetical protein